MYISTRKLDRLRAYSGSNCGWSTDSLVTGPDKYIARQNRTIKPASYVAKAARLRQVRLRQVRARSRNTYGRPTAYLVHLRKPDKPKALNKYAARQIKTGKLAFHAAHADEITDKQRTTKPANCWRSLNAHNTVKADSLSDRLG